MKFYLVVISSVCIGLMSCKKDRTCSCTVVISGSTTTHSQTAGNTIDISPLPPVVIVPATDTTYLTPYSYTNSKKTTYDKVSKKTMHKNCESSSEETFNDQSNLITAGSSTVTTTKSERRVYTCTIN